MSTLRPFLVLLVLASTAFAGCIGGSGDDLDPSGPGLDAAPTDDTGSVKGQVVTAALDEVEKAAIAAIGTDGSIVAQTETTANGDYVLNGLKPGAYKVQVSALCCKAAVKQVQVEAKKVAEANFKLDVLTAADLGAPHMEPNEWSGFIACGARAGLPGTQTLGVALCSAADDPNDDFIHYFTMGKGVKTVVIGMDWTPVGGVSGGKLSIDFEEGICEELACADAYTYAEADGDPPFVLRVDVADITEPEANWDTIETEEEFKFRIFAGTDYANLVYQQPFTVYWYEFYNEPAPEGFNPLPDG